MASEDDKGLADALARTRRSYDETPYVFAPMMRSHPGRLAAQAVWRGLDAPEARGARILEIGCASGGNILPLAEALPTSSFLGVDLSGGQIAAAETRRRRYGLNNVELRAESFEALSAADGEFEFIICHGVYSWIPETLREALLRVVRERLASSGVALVSFNVLPGWRLFQIARDALLLHAGRVQDHAERARKTRELFALLAAQSANERSYGKFWRDEATRMAAGGDAYLAHEIFEDSNAPETFADFAARAARQGLEYLSESVPSANNPADLAPEGAASIDALAAGDRLQREVYIDIFSGRSFREALLVRAGRTADLAPEPPEAALDALHYIPALGLQIDADTEGFRLGAKGTELAARDLTAEPALRRLVERSPRSSRIRDLLAAGEDAAAPRKVLRHAVEAGLVTISTDAVDCAFRLPERPRAARLARIDAPESEQTVTLRHAAIKLSQLQRFLAPLMDGTRTRDELSAAAIEMFARGGVSVSGHDGPVTDPADVHALLQAGVDAALAALLRNALLDSE